MECMERTRFEQLLAAYSADLRAIQQGAAQAHALVNQLYDGNKPYSFHLDMVADLVREYGHLILQSEDDLLPLFMGAWYHDTIEDARLSYNDVRSEAARLGFSPVQVTMAAEIVYALTNEKGRTRAERAGERYYEGIRQTPYAPFCKMCDRLANYRYSLCGTNGHNHRMKRVYEEEMPHFLASLHTDAEDPRLAVPEEMLLKL